MPASRVNRVLLLGSAVLFQLSVAGLIAMFTFWSADWPRVVAMVATGAWLLWAIGGRIVSTIVLQHEHARGYTTL